jgi:SsrA-binding protein
MLMAGTIHNHKAGRDYFILESFEAGIELRGTEVKSLRNARASIDEAYARVERGQVFLYNAHINPYEFGNRNNVDPLRPRRLLLHKREINRLTGQLNVKGMALIPLKIYFTKSFAKVQIALAKGKQTFDKRETLKRKTSEREVERAMRDSRKK